MIYDVNGNPLISYLGDRMTSRTVYTSGTTGQSQGSCIDDDGNIYTVYYQAGKITKYNIYTKQETVYTFTANAYGHANDATFCPETGLVYVASMNTTGEVYALDPANNMALDTTYIAKGSGGSAVQIWDIAYDRRTGQFIAFDTNNNLLRYDTSFDLVSSTSIEGLSTKWPATRQGMDTDGIYIYFLSYDPNVVNVVDMSANIVATYELDISSEPETLVYDWNTGMMFVQDCQSNTVKIRLLSYKDWVSAAYVNAVTQIF